MRNIFVVNALVASGDVALNVVDTALTARQLMVVGDSNIVIDDATLPADLAGVKNFNFITKYTAGNLKTSVPIPRRYITNYNLQMYSAPQNTIKRLGSGLNDANKLIVPSEGEVSFLIKNLSYNHTISTQRITVSLTKKAAETPEQFVDRIIVQLNAANAAQGSSIYTAIKLGSGANLGIQWTTSNEHIDLYIGVSGILESNIVETTQEAKVSMGAGADVVAMEKDLSKHLGHSGYIENDDLFYSQTLEAKASENYNIITIDWSGVSPTPSNTIKVASDSIMIAIPTDVILTPFTAMFALLIGQAFTAEGGAVNGTDQDTNDIDNDNTEE